MEHIMSAMKQQNHYEPSPPFAAPREAYEYEDDVTKEGVEKVRRKAREAVEKADLELVDGFGRYSA